MRAENVGVHLMLKLKGPMVKCFKVTFLFVVRLKLLARKREAQTAAVIFAWGNIQHVFLEEKRGL